MSQYSVIFTSKSELQIAEILEQGALQYGPADSRSYIVSLRKKCQSVSVFPDRYPLDSYTKHPNTLRSFVHKAHKIFYRVNEVNKQVEIIAVLPIRMNSAKQV